MSLKARAQQHESTRGTQDDQAVARPIQVLPRKTWGIVDDELVQILAITDEKDMSLAYVCANPETGDNAAVPFSQTRIFPGLGRRAVQALLNNSGGPQQQRNPQSRVSR